jgi:hypothetical protein
VPRGTVCGQKGCKQKIKPCAPCCGRSGWVHAETGRHCCDPSKEFERADPSLRLPQGRYPQARPWNRERGDE